MVLDAVLALVCFLLAIMCRIIININNIILIIVGLALLTALKPKAVIWYETFPGLT